MLFRKSTGKPPSRAPRSSAKTARTAQESRHALEQFLDVKALQGSAVLLQNGTAVALIEVTGEPFGLLSLDEQEYRLQAYARVLNSVPEGQDIQITVMVEPSPLTGVLHQWEALTDHWAGQVLEPIAAGTHDLIQEFADHVLAETVVLTVIAQAAEDAIDRAQRLISQMEQHHFHAVLCPPQRAAALLMTGYGQDPVSLNAILRGPLSRWAMAPDQPDALPLEASPEGSLADSLPHLRDVLMPSALVEKRGMLQIGPDVASTYVAVAFPELAQNGWLEPLTHWQHPGIRRRTAFYFHPLASAQVMGELNRKLLDYDTTLRWNAKRGLRPNVDTERGLEAAEILRNDLGRGSQRVFNTVITITLMASDVDTLHAAETRFRNDMAGYNVVVHPLVLEEAQGFRASLPLGMLPALGLQVRPRSLPTLVLATTFPFTAGEYLDPEGDLWGMNLATGNAVIVDPRSLMPGHMIVVAPTGSGKSFALKTLATQAILRGDEDVIIFDPSDPIDYERWAWLMGASYVRFGTGSHDRINPMEILLPLNPQDLSGEMPRPVTDKVGFVATLMEMMAYPHTEMPPEERARLEPALYQLYQRWGFDDTWESVLDTEHLTARPQAKVSPTLRDALAAIRTVPGLESLALRLQPFVEGSLDMFAGSTTIDLNQPTIVFNVRHFAQRSGNDHLQAVAYAMIAETIRWRLAALGRRMLVMIDEAHIMFRRADTAQMVSRLFRMARKQGGRVALITQGIVDLLGDPETMVSVPGQVDAKSCLDNSGVRLFLANDNEHDVKRIQTTFHLTDAEARMIRDARGGQGLLLAGTADGPRRRAFLQIMAPPALYPWITTKPDEVNQFRQQGVFGIMEEDQARRRALAAAAAALPEGENADASQTNPLLPDPGPARDNGAGPCAAAPDGRGAFISSAPAGDHPAWAAPEPS